MAAVSKNGVIGRGLDIPWQAKGEQLLFKAMTYNQWLIVGRKTFDSMGKLPNRKYAVISRSDTVSNDPEVLRFNSVESALDRLSSVTNHAIVSGGGVIYHELISKVSSLHLSVIDVEVDGDIYFPEVPRNFNKVFQKDFESNLNYRYKIYVR